MKSKKRLSLLMALCMILGLVVVGCGDDDDEILTPISNPNTASTVQVQFNRSNVLAQTTQNGFAQADTYVVSVLEPGTTTRVVPDTYVSPDNTRDLQVIFVSGLNPGTYDVVVTAYLNDAVTGQVVAPGVDTVTGATSVVGTGSSQVGFAVYTGGYTPATPSSQGVDGSGAYGSGGYGGGAYDS